MDKDMIKIDDLLRQRLGDAEEQERPGAWLRMKDVLDQQMPAGKVPAAAVNWRRMFAYVAGLALLAALSVGGYQMSQSFSSGEGDIAENNTQLNSNHASATTGLAGTAINSLPDTRVEAETAAQPAPAADVAPNSAIVTQSSATNTNNNTAQPQQNTTNHNNNNVVASGNTKAVSSNKLNAATNQPAATAVNTQKNNTNTAGNTNTVNNNSTVSDNTPANNKAAKNTTNHNNSQQPVAAAGSNSAAKAPQANNNKPAATASNTAKQATQEAAKKDAKYDEREVPVQKFEVAQKTDDNGKTVFDTTSVEEGIRKIRTKNSDEEHNVAATNKIDDNASGSEMNPASAAPSAKKDANSEEAGSQKLGDRKTAGKSSKNYNPHRFEQMVENAKYRMGNIKFYPGVVVGANAAFNGNTGFHGGLALRTKVSDRWEVLTEVKYAYMFNGGNNKVTMQDDYREDVQPTVVNGQAVYTYDSVEHYFNFNNYTVLDIPLLVTYKYNKVAFMAGVDFNYNFKIASLAEVEIEHKSESPRQSTNNTLFNTEKSILLTDFAPTMNLAPMIGVGYELTPAWRVDLRLSKPVWNNASTFGQKEIAKELYSVPKVQLNMSWRFINNKPYKRAR